MTRFSKVDHPDQIREIFDAISYAKGASVIRMLAAHLGVENFMRGDKKQMVLTPPYSHVIACDNTIPGTVSCYIIPGIRL